MSRLRGATAPLLWDHVDVMATPQRYPLSDMAQRWRVVAVSAVMVVGGCVSSMATRPMAHVNAREDGSLIWPYWPTSIRVHPLTRIREGDSGSAQVLDVRIEASDGEGLVTRALGTLELDLVASPSSSSSQPVITAWTFDLTDLAENMLRFDDVTRTYLLSLELPSDLPTGTWRLAARLQVPGQHDLVASIDIRR